MKIKQAYYWHGLFDVCLLFLLIYVYRLVELFIYKFLFSFGGESSHQHSAINWYSSKFNKINRFMELIDGKLEISGKIQNTAKSLSFSGVGSG